MAQENNPYYDGSYPTASNGRNMDDTGPNNQSQYQFYNNIPITSLPLQNTYCAGGLVTDIEAQQLQNAQQAQPEPKPKNYRLQPTASEFHPRSSQTGSSSGGISYEELIANSNKNKSNENRRGNSDRYDRNSRRGQTSENYGTNQNYFRNSKYGRNQTNTESGSRYNPPSTSHQSESLGGGRYNHFRDLDFSQNVARQPARGIKKYYNSNQQGYNQNPQGFNQNQQGYTQSQQNYNQNHQQNYKRSWARDNGSKSEPPQRTEVEPVQSQQNYKRSWNRDNGSKTEPPQRSEVEPVQRSVKKPGKNLHIENFHSLREKLTNQARKGTIECLVCCERVRQDHSMWACDNCYHILHLNCIKKWATSSLSNNEGWRCPACQHVTREIPNEYYCYCKKLKNPECHLGELPHSCGNSCGRLNAKRPDCTHKCTLPCHPGPCPECTVQINRKCGCEATSQAVQCSNQSQLTCTNICNKPLNCGIHFCEKKCHSGECSPCPEIITQVCHCNKKTRQVPCTKDSATAEVYSCGEICGNLLACGNHNCKKLCHDDACEECELSPDFVTTCHCGQTELADIEKRFSCLDPIPCCDKICNKKLKCGQPYNPHLCQTKCHDGECPKCNLTTLVRCRCGHMDREIPCVEITGRPDDARCEKKCSKKRLCGRHKCNKPCCLDVDHECELPCNRKLTCGKHRCEATCHRGRCLPCLQSSFEELYCECGANVIYPPVPCGTRPPACENPCSRQHDCDHKVLHNCHSEETCPPCTMLSTKQCYGGHEVRKTIPCHQEHFSCGRPCGKNLPCGRHKCLAKCHPNGCYFGLPECVQQCTTPRAACGHPCGAPCHDGDCPTNISCKEMVTVKCECGHRSMQRNCTEQTRDYQKVLTSMLALKMKDAALGNSVDISLQTRKEARLKMLECNDECRLIERNRRLAIGLQIKNPDLSQKLTPKYSDFMKQWAKKDSRFCQRIHDKLTELVQLAKQSKQKSRSYSFESMNRDKRHFIHEYCEHFGCESAAYDQEPNRNIVATASKDKAWLPSHSLLEVIQRESGQRKVPGPVLRGTVSNVGLNRNSIGANQSGLRSSQVSTSLPLSSRLDSNSRLDYLNAGETPASVKLKSTTSELTNVAEIDYFDNPPL